MSSSAVSPLNEALKVYSESVSLIKQKYKKEFQEKCLQRANSAKKSESLSSKAKSAEEWERKISLIKQQLADPYSPLMLNRHSCRPNVRWDLKKTPEIKQKRYLIHEAKVIQPEIILRRTKLALLGMKLGIPIKPSILANLNSETTSATTTTSIRPLPITPTPFITLENIDQRIKDAINNPMHSNRSPKEIVKSHLDSLAIKKNLRHYFKENL